MDKGEEIHPLESAFEFKEEFFENFNTPYLQVRPLSRFGIQDGFFEEVSNEAMEEETLFLESKSINSPSISTFDTFIDPMLEPILDPFDLSYASSYEIYEYEFKDLGSSSIHLIEEDHSRHECYEVHEEEERQ